MRLLTFLLLITCYEVNLGKFRLQYAHCMQEFIRHASKAFNIKFNRRIQFLTEILIIKSVKCKYWDSSSKLFFICSDQDNLFVESIWAFSFCHFCIFEVSKMLQHPAVSLDPLLLHHCLWPDQSNQSPALYLGSLSPPNRCVNSGDRSEGAGSNLSLNIWCLDQLIRSSSRPSGKQSLKLAMLPRVLTRSLTDGQSVSLLIIAFPCPPGLLTIKLYRNPQT